MAAVLLMILKALGWLLAAVLLLLAVLLILPVQLQSVYNENGFSLRGGFCGLLLPLYPRGAGAKGSKKKAKTEQAEPEQPKKEKKKFKAPPPRVALQILQDACRAVKRLCRSLQIREVTILYTVHGKDASATAMEYGRIHAAIGGGYAAAKNLFDIRVRKINIQPDFAGQAGAQKHFSCKITARLYIIIVLAIYVLLKAAWAMRKGGRR